MTGKWFYIQFIDLSGKDLQYDRFKQQLRFPILLAYYFFPTGYHAIFRQ